MKIGMIGVGLMGHGIARNVMRRGGFALGYFDHPGNQPTDELDGLGAPAIPDKLANLPAWRQRYIGRRIRRFYLRIGWETGNRSESWEDSQKL